MCAHPFLRDVGTSRDTVDFILARMGSPRFSAKPAFGEYVIYADGKIVALVCDDRLYVKDLPATAALAELCEKGPPYPGAKPHFVLEEGQVASMRELPSILLRAASGLPTPRPKKGPPGKPGA